MAGGSANGSRTYEEFEPFCKWQREEGEDTIDIHLQDFKKEHLKVQSNNRGILLITGERQSKAAKWTHFRKEIKLAKNCIVPEIRAKFSGGVLTIVMPKKLPVLQTVTDNTGKSATTSQGVADSTFGLKGLRIRRRTAITVGVVVVLTLVMVTLGDYWSRRYIHKAT